MRMTPFQVANYEAKHRQRIPITEQGDSVPIVAIPLVIKPSTDEQKLNKTEAAFLSHLRTKPGFIYIQSITLKLGDDCRYTTDFLTAWQPDGLIAWEVKGFWRDDARVKIKVAARMYPFIKFIAVQRERGGWKFEEIKP